MLICLAMIIVVMMQESKNSGFGALSGQVDSDSYVRSNFKADYDAVSIRKLN